MRASFSCHIETYAKSFDNNNNKRNPVSYLPQWNCKIGRWSYQILIEFPWRICQLAQQLRSLIRILSWIKCRSTKNKEIKGREKVNKRWKLWQSDGRIKLNPRYARGESTHSANDIVAVPLFEFPVRPWLILHYFVFQGNKWMVEKIFYIIIYHISIFIYIYI